MALQEYECPACGGYMEFDAALQKLKCPFCDTVISVDDYKSPHKEEEKKEDEKPSGGWTDKETEDMYVYTCQSCGGEIIGGKTLGSTACPFCNNNVVMKEKFEGDLRPDYIIPFKITKEQAKESYKNYLKDKKILPKVFSAENHIDEIKGLYVPYWLYDTTVNEDVTYSCTKVKTWSDRDYHYTDTSYYEVTRNGDERFEHIPVDASKEMPDDMMESLEPFNFTEAIPFNTGFLAGFLANRYDVEQAATQDRIKQRVSENINADIKETVKGYASVVEKSKNIDIKKMTTKYALYPVWLLATTWRDEHYLFAVNGQTGAFVGRLPVDKGLAFKYYLKWAGVCLVIAALIIFFMISRL
ncbi:MAG: hypothetical protein K6A23_14730 [Butyrivibrio sp.]|nr:hypothetical protein [Butyrivibrio sp.]